MTIDAVRRYHDGTKHFFDRFARSLGYLDWASQPNPFRSFRGAPVFPLERTGSSESPQDGDPAVAAPVDRAAISRLLRYSLGLSAWKSFRRVTGTGETLEARWSLRVNPSSGNLHPTEAYVIVGTGTGLPPGVYHYAPDRHVLEQRCTFDDAPSGLFVALTSIHWREAWKYGERAFRYCHHDIGHAIAAVRIATALEGWRATLIGGAADCDVATLVGIDRDEDFAEAEREDAACVLAIGPSQDFAAFVAAARAGHWTGAASQLSEDHVQWTFIDEIAAATRDPGGARTAPAGATTATRTGLPSRALLLARRSAVAFDARTSIAASAFTRILERTLGAVPFDALGWRPRIHLVLFVHRVGGVDPGLYCLARDVLQLDRLKEAMHPEFLWESASDALPLFALVRGDCRRIAARLSCDQDIAADGYFSLGMLAEFDASLGEFGPSFYRRLFWEAGAVGQALYLAAEAAGGRGTGIGCFYDDPVHELLGIRDRAYQSLYHFAAGTPVEDSRLTTEPGYAWERT